MHFLSLQFPKNRISCLLSRILCSLDLIQALLLLSSVLAHHFILKRLHFFLALDQCPLLIYRQDHVCLRLLLLQRLNTGHLTIFSDHSLNNRVNLFFLPQVLRFGLCFQLLVQLDLILNLLLVL